MIWKWLVSYIFMVVMILHRYDALRLSTLVQFSNKFRILVDELAIYFEPCGFPIELVARFCMEKLQKIPKQCIVEKVAGNDGKKLITLSEISDQLYRAFKCQVPIHGSKAAATEANS